MYGLIKLANAQTMPQEETVEKTPVTNAALAAGGTAAIAASRDKLLGRQRMFYGTTKDKAEAIRRDGFKDSFLTGDDLDDDKLDAIRTANIEADTTLDSIQRMQMKANQGLHQSYELVDNANMAALDAAGGPGGHMVVPMSATDGILRADPDSVEAKKSMEQLRRYVEELGNSAIRREQFLEASDRLEPGAGLVQVSVPYGIDLEEYSLRKNPNHVLGDVGNFISRFRESVQYLPDYAKHNKGRFATGAALAGAGAGALGIGLKRSNDQYED